MAAKQVDAYANTALVSVTESALNTLTFKKLETGISINEKVAWIISRIEYFLNAVNATNWNGDGDGVDYGLSVSSSFTSTVLTETTIIDFNYLGRRDIGAAATGLLFPLPQIKDFASLPGGGILVPPSPLYAFVKQSGAAATAMTVVARILYTTKILEISEFWELVESRRVLSS